MTAVDHAELKRLADELRAIDFYNPSPINDEHLAAYVADVLILIQSAHAALLSEIEGLKAERDARRDHA